MCICAICKDRIKGDESTRERRMEVHASCLLAEVERQLALAEEEFPVPALLAGYLAIVCPPLDLKKSSLS